MSRLLVAIGTPPRSRVDDWGRVLGQHILELRMQGMSLAVAEGCAPRAEQILKSRFYLGQFEWADKTFAGKHEALFTSEEWPALQQTLNGVPALLRAGRRAAFQGALARAADCRERAAQPCEGPSQARTAPRDAGRAPSAARSVVALPPLGAKRANQRWLFSL